LPQWYSAQSIWISCLTDIKEAQGIFILKLRELNGRSHCKVVTVCGDGYFINMKTLGEMLVLMPGTTPCFLKLNLCCLNLIWNMNSLSTLRMAIILEYQLGIKDKKCVHPDTVKKSETISDTPCSFRGRQDRRTFSRSFLPTSVYTT